MLKVPKFPTTDAMLDVLVERERQKTAEGYTEEHDNEHTSCELARAAECYVAHYRQRAWRYEGMPQVYRSEPYPENWPWDDQSWKPKSPRQDLVRAAALLLAEIERLDRIPGSNDAN